MRTLIIMYTFVFLIPVTMPRGRQLEHPWTPWAGVRSDFGKLLKLFSDSNSVRYEQFAEIWRELKMSFIFTGRDSEKELREVLP